MDMGTGKSKVLLDTLMYLIDQKKIDARMVFSNKGSYANWVTEHLPTHLSDKIPVDICLWRASMTKKGKENLRNLAKNDGKLKIFIMNIEALSYDRSFKVALNFVKTHKTFSTIDESTMIKNHKSARTKAAWKIRDVSTARRILTGSVADNRPLDVWAQFEFLSNGCLGYKSYYAFRNQYADLEEKEIRTPQGFRKFKVVKGYKNLDRLRESIAKVSFIIKKKDCLDLPPKVYQRVNVELTPEQKTLYDQLSQNLMAFVDGEVMTVKIILTKMLRLHQLVCGHMKDDEGKIHKIKNNRIPALMEVLEETNGMAIIWANYREDIFEITRELKKEYGQGAVLSYFGDTSDKDRDYAKKVFKRGADSEGVRFLVGNTQTGAYGLTLTGANTVIYYSNNFDAEKRNQSEDRAHRIGQTDRVNYVDLVSPGTIDEKILAALRQKKSLSDVITMSNWKEFV